MIINAVVPDEESLFTSYYYRSVKRFSQLNKLNKDEQKKVINEYTTFKKIVFDENTKQAKSSIKKNNFYSLNTVKNENYLIKLQSWIQKYISFKNSLHLIISNIETASGNESHYFYSYLVNYNGDVTLNNIKENFFETTDKSKIYKELCKILITVTLSLRFINGLTLNYELESRKSIKINNEFFINNKNAMNILNSMSASLLESNKEKNKKVFLNIEIIEQEFLKQRSNLNKLHTINLYQIFNNNQYFYYYLILYFIYKLIDSTLLLYYTNIDFFMKNMLRLWTSFFLALILYFIRVLFIKMFNHFYEPKDSNFLLLFKEMEGENQDGKNQIIEPHFLFKNKLNNYFQNIYFKLILIVIFIFSWLFGLLPNIGLNKSYSPLLPKYIIVSIFANPIVLIYTLTNNIIYDSITFTYVYLGIICLTILIWNVYNLIKDNKLKTLTKIDNLREFKILVDISNEIDLNEREEATIIKFKNYFLLYQKSLVFIMNSVITFCLIILLGVSLLNAFLFVDFKDFFTLDSLMIIDFLFILFLAFIFLSLSFFLHKILNNDALKIQNIIHYGVNDKVKQNLLKIEVYSYKNFLLNSIKPSVEKAFI